MAALICARLRFLTESDIAALPQARFVTHSITISGGQHKIWEVLTKPENAETLRPVFDAKNELQPDWRKRTNVNYHYPKAGQLKGDFANLHFGCFYVQNDYDHLNYTEKFLLLEDQKAGTTELRIVCGPFVNDFNRQEAVLKNWGLKVKELSEK